MSNLPYFSGFTPLPSSVQSSLMPDAMPHYLNPNADTVVVCVHGFTGNPYEIYPASEALAAAGFAAVAPLLPGHGYQDEAEQRQKFAQITRDGLLDAVRREIAQARQRYQRVGILGFSMGGAIALSMAGEGLVDVCAVVAPALRLPRRAEILIPLLSWAKFYLDAPVNDGYYRPVYEFHHSRALRTLWQLAGYGRQNLPKITCPVLGIHSTSDETIPPVVLDLMQQQIPQMIQTAWFNESGHVMLRDKREQDVAQEIARFFQQQFS